MQFAYVLGATAALSQFAGSAHAEKLLESDTSSTNGSSLRLDVGMSSPVGELGLVYSRPIQPNLALELGAG